MASAYDVTAKHWLAHVVISNALAVNTVMFSHVAYYIVNFTIYVIIPLDK